MNILITGDRGFVGSETRKLLEKSGHNVVGYDIMDGFDIRDKKQLENAIKNAYELKSDGSFGGKVKIDRVLHLAAIARFDEADANPIRTHETNVLGTMNVVDVCDELHIPLVFASTGSAYMPIKQTPPITENYPIMGNSVYGCSKALSELYVRKHNPHIVLRYAHLYGAEKRFHGLIGGFLSRIEHDLQPILYGGKQSNDFMYIKDVARINKMALEASWDKWNEVYNAGTGQELSAKDAGDIICDVFGYKGGIEVKEGRTVDAERFFYDMTKAKMKLGFEPEYDFKKGLEDMKKEMATKNA